MLNLLKKKFRKIYYSVFDGKTVSLQGYPHLEKFKWIISSNYGRAYYKGYYEPKICNYLLENIDKESVFIDIGAHAGYFSLFVACIATKGKVISFEPVAENQNFIKDIISLNQLENLNLIEKAVGNKLGTAFFSEGTTSSTGKVTQEGLEVPITFLDEELKAINKVDLIKIDVEGYGGRVLEGSRKTLRRFKPKIMMEIHAGSDELEVAIKYLLPIYHLIDLETGKEIKDKKASVHFIIAEPRIP